MGRPGWFAVYRQSFDHWLARDSKPFSPLLAWYYLIGWAAWDDEERMFMHELFKLKRGEHVTTYRQLARDWGWSNHRVSRFIERLQKCDMIVPRASHSCMIVSVCNYGTYQFQDSASSHETSHERPTGVPPASHEVIREEQTTTEEPKNPNQEASSLSEKSPGQPLPEGSAVDFPDFGVSRRLLLSVGTDGGAVKMLAMSHTVRRVYLAVEYAKGKKNPGGMAREALENDWNLPPANGAELHRINGELVQTKARLVPKRIKSDRKPGETDDDFCLRKNAEMLARRADGQDSRGFSKEFERRGK